MNLEANTLNEWLGESERKKFVIIDVRDDDFAGGHIKGKEDKAYKCLLFSLLKKNHRRNQCTLGRV